MEKFSDKKLMEALIEKYENSVISTRGSNRKLKIKENTNNSKLFPHYWENDGYLYRESIHQGLMVLKNWGFIEFSINLNEEIEEVSLVTSSIEKIYSYLNKQNPAQRRNEIIDFLTHFKSSSRVIQTYKEYLLDRLNNYLSIDQEIKDSKELQILLLVIFEMESLKENTLKRHFSQKILKDSKAFQQIEGKICSIFRRFEPIHESASNEEILNYYNLFSTPTYVHVKGNLVIKMDSQTIQLDSQNEWVFTDKQIESIELLSTTAKKVITIENLSPFIEFEDIESLVIYTGGFHGRTVRSLLKKISNQFPTLLFYHFGDIDAGGFHIYNDLLNKTGIAIKPLFMDRLTLEKNKEYWKPLTENDRRKLILLKNEYTQDLIDFMLKNDCKLEQESLFTEF